MRICLSILLLLIAVTTLVAQTYGDEWVNSDKQYWRLQTAKDGVYRISYTDLENSGFPVSTLDPRRIQLYHRGEEQAIYIEGQSDAVFNPTDFIQFYGVKNDGTLDRQLYTPQSFQPHDLYNIYSDSTAYFLSYTLSPVDQGKRMRVYKENNTGGLPPESFSRGMQTLVITDQYAPGVRYNSSDVTRLTSFDQGEGWTGLLQQEGQSRLFTVSNIDGLTTGLTPQLELMLQGRDDLPHVVEILAGPNASSVRNLGQVNFQDYESFLFNAPLTNADFSTSGELLVLINCIGENGGNDLISTSFIRVSYSELPDMQGSGPEKFRFSASSGTKAYVEIQNVPAGSEIFDVSNPSNVEIVRFNTAGSGINAIIQNAAAERELFITNTFEPVLIKPAAMREINPMSANYIIISHELLHAPALGYQDPVRAIATYRASAAGGSFDTLVVDMRTLYDQFSYGETTPLAIYNFMKKLVAEGRPEYLFLVGKGMEPQHNFFRNPTGYFEVTKEDNGVTYQLRDLVPSAGNPGADVAFTAGLGTSTYEAAVATGRIPATNSQDVAAYLEKVIAMESQPYDDLYRKELLHLSGGIAASELRVFRSYMDGFAEIARGQYLGGQVTTIQKDNTANVVLININEEINDGLSLVTFFGHSAPSVTDIDIGFVTDTELGYNNPGKYPMFLVNGCQAGQFYSNDVNFGEDWINARNLGATGFIAHSSFGFQFTLRRYSDIFYETAFGDSLYINKPIGNIHQEVARRYMNISAPSPLNITQVQQMAMLGDPATYLFAAPYPDYETNSNQLSISATDGQPVTSRTPELELSIITRNFGKVFDDSVHVRVTRTLNDNSVLTYDSVYSAVYFQDTLKMVIPNGFTAAGGNNQFSVVLDFPDDIPELNENNNTGILQYFIPTFSTRNLYPVNFAITNSTSVELITQSTDPLSLERGFAFELDTARSFNSPLKREAIITGKVLARWDPGPLQTAGLDSITYFWRTRYSEPGEDESDDWEVSSFSYINNGPEGWTQRVYHQFDEDVLLGLDRDDSRQKIDFIESNTNVDILTAGMDNALTRDQVSVSINDVEYIIQNQFCRDNTLNFIAFNRNTGIPYPGLPLPVTDSRTCGRQPQIINSFNGSQMNLASGGVAELIDLLPDGDMVVFFNIGQINYSTFSGEVEAALQDIGIAPDEFNGWINGEPLIVIGRKGSSEGSATIYKAAEAPATEQLLFQESVITGILDQGMIYSSQIGPARTWDAMQFATRTNMGDEVSIAVVGISLAGMEEELMNNVTDGPVDLSGIDAATYPYLRLQAALGDLQDRTTPYLDYWQVSYEGVPEGMLIASEVEEPQVTVPEGAVVENTFGFVNISTREFIDSLQVNYTLLNTSQQQSTQEIFRILAPDPGDTTLFTIETPTTGQAGLLDYAVRVNPRIEPEQYYDNNQFDERAYIRVGRDDINPVLDVVFDGAYIMDGDIVSPDPVISIKIRDENTFLLKADTAGISLSFRPACEGCPYQKVDFSSDRVSWTPASEDEPFTIEYRPGTLEDGLYGLRVQASDASGNTSGEEAYEINFQVINESSITNFYPYPNPFSTNTRFVFTLTGAEIPQGIKIQIMTVSGKVVREITQDELGPIHAGHNISEYAWDGRDEYGDRLANGVYLYRVILDTATQFEHRETSGDKAFRKGFGKLYILR